MIAAHIVKQIATLIDKCQTQPLPSQIYEQLAYNIEEVDGEKVYQYIVQEINTHDFLALQDLKDIDYHLIKDALQYKVDEFKFAAFTATNTGMQRAFRSDIRRLEELIEKVVLVRENVRY